MTIFVIEPYVGALPLKFGMKPRAVSQIMGKPTEVSTDHKERRTEEFPLISLGYSDSEELNAAVFSPGCDVVFDDKDLFQVPDPIKFLRRFDNSPYEWVGFIVFYDLGIRLSGFHDDDQSQKAIGIVAKGYWDSYKRKFTPYKG